jgi:hypothetical protein
VKNNEETFGDQTSRDFIRLICHDPELDFRLSQLLVLFGTDMPETHGGYAHHYGR